MSILKLTENLENFQWTDYDNVGDNLSSKSGRHGGTEPLGQPPHPEEHSKFDDGVGKGVYPNDNPQTFDVRGHTVTGTKTFDRPNESALVTMQSEFAVQSEPETRGPYSLSDFMDGTKQGRGFIYPGGAPLGFTMDMESLAGDVVSNLYVDGDISLTPLSYTVAGMNSDLNYGDVTEQTLNVIPIAPDAWGDYNVPLLSYSSTWTPEQISGNASNFDAIYDRSVAYIPDYPESPISSFLDFTRGSVGLGRIGLISPNWNPYEFSSTPMIEFGPDAPSLPYVIPETNYTGPILDFVDTFNDTPKLDHAHSTDSLSRLLSYPGLYVGSSGNIIQGQDVRPSISSPGWRWTSIDGSFDHTALRSRLYDVYQHHFQLTDVNFVNIPYGNDLFDETGATTPWKVGSIHIGTDDIAGVLGGGVNYYGDLKSLAGRSSIYMDENGDYRVPTIEATTVPPGITEQYPSNILDFTVDQITHNIPQITLSGPFGDEDYQSTLQLTPISADAHGSNTVPLENYASQYSPDDAFWPNYAEPWPDKIFHELSPEGTKLYDHFGSPFSVPFNHLNLNLNPFLNQITLDMFGNMSYITFEGWKQGSIHIPSDQTSPATTWEDMTFPEANKTTEVYQHHFLTSPFTPITVGTDLFDETGATTPWKGGSIHIIDGDTQGAPHPNSIFHQLGLISGTQEDTTSGDKNYKVYNSIDNVTFSNLLLETDPFHDGWKDGSIHIPSDVTEAAAIGGQALQFANLDAFNPLGTPFPSIYQNPENMKYTIPSDFDDISENPQRTFNVQGAYPNNIFSYSIGDQFGYSYSERYITDSLPIQSTNLFPPLYEDFTLSDELSGEFAGTALSAIFYQAQADNPNWPYKGVGLGDNLRLLPQQLPDTYQPYVIKDVGERTIVGRDNIVLASLAAAEDIERINQWGASPIGKNWIRNQTFLQDLNPRPETRDFSMLGIQASLLPFVHTQRHSTTFTGEGEDSYGNYWKNYGVLGKPEAFFLDESTVETWGYGTRLKDGFGKIGKDIEDVDGDFKASTEHHYSRLTKLTNKFIVPTSNPDEGDWLSGFKNYIGGMSRFGGTPDTPTQYVFSQRGPFGEGNSWKNESTDIRKKYILTPYQVIGSTRYDASLSPSPYPDDPFDSEMSKKAFEIQKDYVFTLAEGARLRTLHNAQQNEVTEKMANEFFAKQDKMLKDLSAATEKYEKDKKGKEAQDLIIDAFTEKSKHWSNIMNVLGSPGAHKNLVTVGDPLKDENGDVIGSGLGLIRKDTDSKSYKTAATDNVNMIPYGYDNIDPATGQPVDDFIKFKFYDKYNKKFIIFRAILSGISDSITPEWDGTKYIGRPDQVYVYSGAERAISFTFDVYPNTKQEFPVLLEKLNYLIGLCYPSYTKQNRMVAPFIELTIGDMFVNTPGFLGSLSLDVDDVGTWETDPGLQFPKHITCQCDFTYIGNYLPSTLGKHYELDWLKDEGWNANNRGTFGVDEFGESTNQPGRHKSDTHSMDKLFSQLVGD